MKIGMVLDSQFPPDIRVENEATSLVQNGHDVHLLSYSHLPEFQAEEMWNGVHVVRNHLSKKLAKKGRGLINTYFDVYTPYWSKLIQKFISEYNPDVLHVHDLFMLGAAYKATNKYNLPIVADLHENYVEGLKHYQFANSFPGNWLISIDRWSKREIEWCKQADHIITVIDEAVNRYSGLGIDPKKISVVANYVNIDDFLDVPDIPDIIKRIGASFSATYIGGFDTHRGLEYTIRATELIRKQIPDFKLVLVGHGNNFDSLKDLAGQLDIEGSILFEGYQNPDTIPSYIKASQICLIPHLKTIHTDNTIPHKLFHYMLLAKPIVASNCDPIERIVNDTQCGFIYQDTNAQLLADKVIQIYKNKTLATEMGKRGQESVHKKYNWQEAEKKLLQLYENL